MLSHRKIGTFLISRVENGVRVRDVDHFNNWGSKYFPDMPQALQWAHWAQTRKSGPTLLVQPPLSWAA